MALIGPRAAILIWWLLDMSRWSNTFDSIIWPIIGAIFLPWTTLAYVLVAPNGVNGIDWIAIAIGIILDLGSYSGGYRRRGVFRI